MRCQICGMKTRADTIIDEPKFEVYKGEGVRVCIPCFNLWISGRNNILMDKVERKLKTNSNK